MDTALAAKIRRLAYHPTRRESLGLLTALLSIPLFNGAGEARKKGRKKPCPPCRKRKKGKCKGRQPDGKVCAGGICQDGVCATCGNGGPCTVFLSSLRYPGNLGGLTGADAKCQALGTAAGLPGTYKAWLADSTSAPASRFTPSSGPYRLVNGTTIAANWTGLTSGALTAPINVTETGGGPAGGVWTNADTDGQERLGGHSCANWSSSAEGSTGIIGDATQATSAWTVGPVTTCDFTHHLYCVQQS